MIDKLSYMNKVCTRKVRFLDSSDILFHFLRSGPPCTAYSIHLKSQPYHSDTRWFRLILYDLYFLKKSLTSVGPFKTNRTIVDPNRSVNLPFDIMKIFCTLILGREKISEAFKCFRSANCHSSWLEGLLASRVEICLFRGRVVEKTRPILMNNSISIKFNLFRFTADSGGQLRIFV